MQSTYLWQTRTKSAILKNEYGRPPDNSFLYEEFEGGTSRFSGRTLEGYSTDTWMGYGQYIGIHITLRPTSGLALTPKP